VPLPPIFDPIVNAPRPQKIVAGVVGALVIAIGGYFLLLAPAQAEVSRLRAQLSALETEIARSRAIVADLLKYRREAAELEARLNALKERLPGEKEIPTLYRALSDAASAAGLGVSLFQPRTPNVRDYYSEIPIALNAEAGYHQIAEFFERVAKLARVVNVTEIRLSGVNRPRVPVRAELVLATYMYRPIGAPPPPKPPGAK
jgi:type IV pilus assembly protein PilO